MRLANGLEIVDCSGKYYAYDIKVIGEYEIVETIGHIDRCSDGYKLIMNTKKPYIFNVSFRELFNLPDLLRLLRKKNAVRI